MKPSRALLLGLWTCAVAMGAGSVGAAGPSRSIGNTPAPAPSPLHVRVVPAPPAPTNAQLAAFAGPNPAGLQSAFPAGLPPPGTPMPPAAGVPTWPIGGIVGPGLGLAGGGAYAAGGGYGGVGAPSSPRLSAGSGGSGVYSAVDIARSFIQADGNRDGELTRAEAARLTIMPYSFEEMDRNHDGIVTRWEYEDAVR